MCYFRISSSPFLVSLLAYVLLGPAFHPFVSAHVSGRMKRIEEFIQSTSGNFAGVVSILPMEVINKSFTSKSSTYAADSIKYFTMGQSNRENSIKYRKEAVFPIGSNTKLYIAVAMYQLEEQGLLKVTDNVNDYLDATDFAASQDPSFDHKAARWCPRVNGTSIECQNITFVQLMAMSSGIVHSLNCDDGNDAAPYCFWVTTDLYQYSGHIKDYVDVFINEPLMFVPGSQYSYSNSNWILLSYIIEKVTGMLLGEYMQNNIFNHILPGRAAHNDNTILYDPFAGQLQVVKNRIDSYRKYVDEDTNTTISIGSCRPFLSPGLASGAGGFWATTEAHVDFYRLLFNGPKLGGPLLTESSVRSILQPRMPLTSARQFFYGQGITVRYEGGAFPASISYCGGIDCTTTCIVQTKDGIFTSFSSLDIVTLTEQDYEDLQERSILSPMSNGALGDANNAAAAVLFGVVSIWENEIKVR